MYMQMLGIKPNTSSQIKLFCCDWKRKDNIDEISLESRAEGRKDEDYWRRNDTDEIEAASILKPREKALNQRDISHAS